MSDSIGNRIRKRREELEMSQDELAKRLGYKSRSSIAKIEKDGRELPQKKIASIANVLQTTPAYIMGWEQTQKKADTITDVVLRMKTDSEFLSLVEKLNKLDAEKISGVSQMLSAFLK